METRLSFEEAFRELENIVQTLEQGTTTLEEALALYEQGVRLATYCEKLLEDAQLRVRVLQRNAQGEVELHDVEQGDLDNWMSA